MNKASYIDIRNVKIGEGMPKICVPLLGSSREELYKELKLLSGQPYDMVEWRLDFYHEVHNEDMVLEAAKMIRRKLGEQPILCTFRTKQEGGNAEISGQEYRDLALALSKSGLVDLIDVELFLGDDYVGELIGEVHAAGVKVVVSNHDFHKTPQKQELIQRIEKMHSLGGDILKIAVMPTCERDVLNLLETTLEMKEKPIDKPIVTMSMGQLGAISRISGELFGSAITFGTVMKSSAPGQIEVNRLKNILETLH